MGRDRAHGSSLRGFECCSRLSGEWIKGGCHSAETDNDTRPLNGWCDYLGLGVPLVDSPTLMKVGQASGEVKTEPTEEHGAARQPQAEIPMSRRHNLRLPIPNESPCRSLHAYSSKP